MNSYTRPRRRPRKDSVSFRTFGWLLTRLAAWQIFFPLALPSAVFLTAMRHTLLDRASLVTHAESIIERLPCRRYFP